MYLTWFWIIFWALVAYSIGRHDGHSATVDRAEQWCNDHNINPYTGEKYNEKKNYPSYDPYDSSL